MIQIYAQFPFFRRGSGNVSPPHFVYNFSRNISPCYILLNDLISLPLPLEVLGNMCITVVCFPSCDIINLNLNLLLIKPLFYMTGNSRQKFKYFENQKSFQGEIRSIFHHFKRLSVAKNWVYKNLQVYSFFVNLTLDCLLAPS